ncbi:MAG: ATP-binding protein [Candidatus Binatia bacterium]
MKRLLGYQFIRQRLGTVSLRAHLFALVMVSMLPFLLIAFLVLNLFASREKASMATGLRETTRALSSALDREFEATKTALESMGTMEDFDSGDLGQVYRRLRRVLQSRPTWRTIALHDPSGQQILNLLNPNGEPLPATDFEQESFRATVTTKQSMPINFHRHPTAGPLVGYRVPVLRAGELRYVLSVEIAPAVFGEILARQKLPAQAVATVVDGRNTIVGTSGRQELVGQLAGPLVRRAAPGQLDGWFEGPDRDGVPFYAAVSRSPTNGWAVALAIPAAHLKEPLTRSLGSLLGAGAVFLVVGILLAVIVEARISEPLDELTRQAGALGRGETVEMGGHSRVTEVENLRRDIGRTAGLLEQRGQERDRAAAALRELNDRLELRILERTEELEEANSELRREIRERHLAEAALRAEHVYLNLLRSTEQVIHEAASIEGALNAALEQICGHLGSPVGYCSMLAVSQQERRISLWYGEADRERFAALQPVLELAGADGSDPASLALTGPGPNCFNDLAAQPEPWARAATDVGLVSACVFAVFGGGEPAGALAFFFDRAIALDQRLSALLAQLAMQLGRAVERQQADEALRLSEERFRSAFDEGPIGIGMVDLEMRYLRVNQVLCAMLGLRGEELLGHEFFANVHPRDLNEIRRHAERLLRGETTNYRHETRLIGKNGEVLWCFITATLIAVRSSMPNYALYLIENITERKRIEEKLRESERLVAVGATAAMFAHEVGNPLNGISTTVQMIERDLPRMQNGVKPSVFSALGDIKSEITRLGALLHEFRYLARPQRLEQKPVRLDGLIGSVLMPNAYSERGVALEIDVPDDLPAISVDEERLKQVVVNLAENAVDAMPEGGTLTVRAYRDGNELCLELADTGIGIPPGVNIFELFTTTKSHGTGLGLAVVRQIVSAHGGRVDYRTVPGSGTSFFVRLPLNNFEIAN